MTKRTTTTTWIGIIAALGLSIGGLGCAGEEGAQPLEKSSQSVNAAAPKAVDTTIEHAVRDVESGQHLDDAKVRLERVLKDTTTTSDQRDDARLALSRLHELKGEQEEAIRGVEEILASHEVSARYPARQLAERRLRFLLTGSEDAPQPDRRRSEVAPVAKALAHYFHPNADGLTKVDLLIFGSTPEKNGAKGIFNIDGALRELKRKACPLCDDTVSVSTSRSHSGSWVAIPAAAAAAPDEGPTFATSMTVFYYDLEFNRIPSRYDMYLPMPSDEIAKRLEKGDGLVAVKVREGAPPAILLAAPRGAMLPDVESAFSRMAELPSEPTMVPLSAKLRPEEIRSVIRDSRAQMKRCYEDLLASNPSAEGKVMVSFAIDRDGSVVEPRLTEDSTLHDPTLQSCFLDVFSNMRFPKSPGKTTVKYPMVLSPTE